MFVFVHRDEIYLKKAWVLADGDDAGKEAITALKKAFSKWPEDHFRNLPAEDFERYYPRDFAEDAERILAIEDRRRQWVEKRALCRKVVAWLDADHARGKKALTASAAEVIKEIQGIAAELFKKSSNAGEPTKSGNAG